MNPVVATRLGLAAADLVQVENRLGSTILRALITDRLAAGQVFAPMHWTSDLASAAPIDTLVPPFST